MGRSGSFDALDQMTAFGVSGSTLTAGYDPSGLRAWKQGSGGKAYTFYAGSSPVAEATSSGALLSVNTFGPLGLLSSQTGPSSETFYAFDARGNVAQRVSASGLVQSTDHYNAYGQLLGSPSGDEFGFGGQAGYRTDPETGLCLLGERYYDPSAGRFLTRDPLGYAGGMDLYAYTDDDPVNGMDPSGLCDDNDDAGCDIIPDSATGPGLTLLQGESETQDKGMAQAGYNAGSFLAHAAPGIGTLLSLNAAVSGCDVVSDSSLSNGQPGMAGVNVALSLLPLLGKLKFPGNFSKMEFMFGRGTPFHVYWKIGNEYRHATGDWMNMTVERLPARYFNLINPWKTHFSIPVWYPQAALQEGSRAMTCLTGALSAWRRGWFGR